LAPVFFSTSERGIYYFIDKGGSGRFQISASLGEAWWLRHLVRQVSENYLVIYK
jgi:hypothetical protein